MDWRFESENSSVEERGRDRKGGERKRLAKRREKVRKRERSGQILIEGERQKK
jgi:hypothetical protein